MTKPLISVIVPVYNVQKYLPMCLDSVLAQTFKDFELICVDDGSTDESFKILQEYAAKDKRIKVIHQENQGVSTARNKAMENVTGQYITFMDSDDYLCSKWFARAAKIIVENAPDCIMCDYKTVTEYSALENNQQQENVQKIENPFELFIERHSPIYPNLWTKIYKAETVGKQRFDEKMTYGEDLWSNIEFLAKAQMLYHVHEQMYGYVKHENSITGSKFNERKALSFLKLCFNAKKYFGETPYFAKIRNNISNLSLKFVLKNLHKLRENTEVCEKQIALLLSLRAVGYKNLPLKYKLKLWKIGRKYK